MPGSHSNARATVSCPCFGTVPWPPRRPLPLLRITVGFENRRSPRRTNVVKVNAVVHMSPYPQAPIFPNRHSLVARSNGPVIHPGPGWCSDGLHDFRLRHSISQAAPAGLKACEPPEQEDQPATENGPCNESSFERECAHRIMPANDQRSHAGPLTPDSPRDGLPALADAPG